MVRACVLRPHRARSREGPSDPCADRTATTRFHRAGQGRAEESCLFHRSTILATQCRPVASGSMQQSLLRCWDIGVPAMPDIQSRVLDSTGKRESECPRKPRFWRSCQHVHGIQRADANSPGWPPDRKAIPGTDAGTTRRRHCTVVSATSATVSCPEQANPASTMLGFTIILSSITRCA